jgi:hypothetical protein
MQAVSSACRYCCGHCVGSFPDPHKSPENSDDEEDDQTAVLDKAKPKDHRKLKKSNLLGKNVAARFKFVRPRGLDAEMLARQNGWFPHRTVVDVEESSGFTTVTVQKPAIKVEKALIIKTMLTSLSTSSELHTIEIIDCDLTDVPPKLNEVDELRVLRLSRNLITAIKKKSDVPGRPPKIEECALDHNQISVIESTMMSGELVMKLKILNLAHNKLEYLPSDFCTGAKELIFLDLSYNALRELPESMMMSCSSLQILILNHNRIVSLPDNFKRLVNLRKLFISYNKLTSLPDDIGSCKQLVKIRCIANDIMVMPDSTINLWKGNGGRLEELLVFRNPLVHPSITAFEMGGLDQAMRLFAEWIREKNEPLAIEDGTKVALASADETEQALVPMGRIDSDDSRMPVAFPADVGGGSTNSGCVVIGIIGGGITSLVGEMLAKIRAAEKNADIVSQRDFWSHSCPVTVRGVPRTSDEEPECINHERFAAKIDEATRSNDIVIVAGSFLVYDARVSNKLDHIFLLECDKEEACKRRTQKTDGRSKPITNEDFHDLAWPAYERYLNEHVEPLAAQRRVIRLQSPSHAAQREDVIFRILQGAEQTAENPHLSRTPNEYYFGHIEPRFDTVQIGKIRSIESSLLLLKRCFYIETQKAKAKQQEADANAVGRTVSAHAKEFLDDDIDYAADWTGKCKVTEFDLFFNLLVYSVKPLYTSCEKLFDKFTTTAQDSIMTRAEWSELCKRVPFKLKVDIQEAIWRLIAWRTQDQNCVELQDFVAAWHIHDVEERDPYIARVAHLMGLEYYDMTIHEMRKRLKAKNDEGATKVLDFDNPVHKHSIETALPQMGEGERSFAPVAGQLEPPMDAAAPKQGLQLALTGGSALAPMLALDNIRFAEREMQLRRMDAEAGEAGFSDESLSSWQLSDGDDTSDGEEFDARSLLVATKKWQDYQATLRRNRENSENRFLVGSDADLTKLMAMSKEEFQRCQDTDEVLPIPKPRAPRQGKRGLNNKRNLRDKRFNTDVYTVRQAIRDAYRNMPRVDFCTFISFALRGIKAVRTYQPTERITYWHTADPSFRLAVDSNKYTREVLRQFGFVCVNETYWVWPQKHLTYDDDRGAWGSRVASPDCPGRDKLRLDDLIKLLRMCQAGLLSDGKKFTGHLKV